MELQRYYEEVRRLIAEEQYDQAEAVLQSIPKQSADTEWNYWMAIIYLKRGWLENAKEYAQKACTAEPQNEQYQMLYQSLTSPPQESPAPSGESEKSDSFCRNCMDCCKCCRDWMECLECFGIGR